jgi:hypothetical protein
MEVNRTAGRVFLKNTEENGCLRDQGVDSRTILIWVLKKLDILLIWFK